MTDFPWELSPNFVIGYFDDALCLKFLLEIFQDGGDHVTNNLEAKNLTPKSVSNTYLVVHEKFRRIYIDFSFLIVYCVKIQIMYLCPVLKRATEMVR